MTFILFVWLYSGGSGLSITSQEFNSRAACVKAAQSIRQEFGAGAGFVCVEKGKPK